MTEKLGFDVVDSGPGIPVELHAQIFDTFFTKPIGKGLGLGLAITRRILDEHGEKVVFHSGLGKARESVCFPESLKCPLAAVRSE